MLIWRTSLGLIRITPGHDSILLVWNHGLGGREFIGLSWRPPLIFNEMGAPKGGAMLVA